MTEENVYRERARLVAFLSTKYPSHLAEASDAEEGFHHVVCVHAPTGQMAWHIADRDRDDFFQHLDVVENDWDGHTTEEKYRRLEILTKSGG